MSQKPLDTLHEHWAGRTRRWDTLVHHVSSNSVHWTNMTQKDALHTKTFQSSYSVRTVTLLHWLTVAQLQKNVPFQQKIWSQHRDFPACFPIWFPPDIFKQKTILSRKLKHTMQNIPQIQINWLLISGVIQKAYSDWLLFTKVWKMHQ